MQNSVVRHFLFHIELEYLQFVAVYALGEYLTSFVAHCKKGFSYDKSDELHFSSDDHRMKVNK